MKAWTDGQRDFICAHLGVDMTGAELGRIFMVNPAEIHQVRRDRRGGKSGDIQPTAFHCPGGIRMWANVKGATIKDAYLVRPSNVSESEWRRRFDVDGLLKPEFMP